MSQASSSYQTVGRTGLHAMRTAEVPQFRCSNKIIPPEIKQWEHLQTAPDPVELGRISYALQNLLEYDAKQCDWTSFFQHVRQPYGLWIVRGEAPPQNQRPDRGINNDAHLFRLSAL